MLTVLLLRCILRLIILLWIRCGAVIGILLIAAEDISACAHTHSHSHKACHCTVSVGAGVLKTFGNVACNVALLNSGVGEHCALVAHIDKVLTFVVVGNLDTYGNNLHTTELIPLLVKSLRHILAKLTAL